MLNLWQIGAEDEGDESAVDLGNRHGIGRAVAPAHARGGDRDGRKTVDSQEQAMGILGHELRNPLSAIAALARGLMRRQDLPHDVVERLTQVDRAAQRSLAMVGSVLDFSEIRSRGSLLVRPVLTDPVALTTALVEELRVSNPGKTITLEVRGQASFVLDPVRIGQVLSNLISNALVHGSVDTPVEVLVDVGDREACFGVINRGRLIPPGRVATLFQPFARGITEDGSGAETLGGLGLGLYIVDVIVSAHGGTITVRSEAEIGTIFTVHLPRLPR